MKWRALTLLLALVLPVGIAWAADFPAGSCTAHKSVTIVLDKQVPFRVTQDGKSQVSGQFRVEGDQLELTYQHGTWACAKRGQQSGTYQWKLDDAGLTLTRITDLFEVRVGTPATSSLEIAALKTGHLKIRRCA